MVRTTERAALARSDERRVLGSMLGGSEGNCQDEAHGWEHPGPRVSPAPGIDPGRSLVLRRAGDLRGRAPFREPPQLAISDTVPVWACPLGQQRREAPHPPDNADARHHLPLGATLTSLFIDAAQPCQHAPGHRWFVDETYVKIAGRWVYPYRAIDQFGQVIDVLVSEKRDLAATRRFFTRALEHGTHPTEVSTDRAQAYLRVLDELLPAAYHVLEKYANNPIESDHGRLKSRLRPMRGLKRLPSARVISAGHAFIQNIRRGHYELGVEEPTTLRVAAFDELALTI